jgi:hypothetical protein
MSTQSPRTHQELALRAAMVADAATHRARAEGQNRLIGHGPILSADDLREARTPSAHERQRESEHMFNSSWSIGRRI